MNYTDSVTGSWQVQYDSLNRLQSASSNSDPYNGLNIQWQYDSFGNRLSQTPSGSTANLPPATTMQYADGTNRITSSSIPGVNSNAYDAAGNLQFDGLNSIVYDAESRVCAVRNVNGTVTQYLYNADGQRVAKGYSSSAAGLVCPTFGDFVPTEKYILGPSGEQITQLNGSDVWQHTNVYANGQLIATYDQEGSQQPLHFHISDLLGTRRVQASASGVAELSFTNLPYGDGFTPSGSGQDATQHHFTGKERDTESGLDYFGARYYGSSMGRWMSPDPSGLAYADPTNPQSLNLYSYVLNNPLTGTDPTGMAYCQWDDGTHDDSANTGVEGAVNSGTECTNAGGTWSHADGLNDDGSQMGSEQNPSLTVTATLVTDTDTTSVTTTGESYDPDDARIYSLVEGVAQDTSGLPWVCNVGVSGRVGRDGSRFQVGADASVGGGIQPTTSINLFNVKGPAGSGVRGNWSVKGGNQGANVNLPIPTTPFNLSVNMTSKHPTVGVGRNVGIPKINIKANVQVYGSFGYLGDPSCRSGH